MYFDHTLIAITYDKSGYAVHSTLRDAWLDLGRIQESPSADVSADNIYQDIVAPLAVWQARKCLPDKPEKSERISQWLDSLPDTVAFLLMHSSEFETFGGD